MSQGFIYLIGNKGLGRYKIGYTTKDPERRLHKLQFMSPVSLELFACKFVDLVKYEEIRLHEMFATHRIQGEWFQLNDEELERVKEKLASGLAACRQGE
jgi:hypothetical protein